jgi:hypothetical protein
MAFEPIVLAFKPVIVSWYRADWSALRQRLKQGRDRPPSDFADSDLPTIVVS